MIGTVIDKYEVMQKVGEGGMATVFRGRHTTLGRDVAIKILHPHLSASVSNRQRFAREARAIEQLDHPNIVRIFDYSGMDSGDCYIVTEFIDGVTLQEFVTEHGRIPSEVVAIIGSCLADALAYAHQRGLVHRDLKPENVMLRRDGILKLMDFGIARFVADNQMTMTGALVGSPAYMSPEQATEGVIDARSDLFSLGTVLFYLLSGKLPFTGTNPSIILRNIIDGNRPELLEVAPDVSPLLADIIERLLQTDPAARYESAPQVFGILRGCLADVGIDPTVEPWSLQRLLVDFDGYCESLNEHLRGVLLEQGRQRLASGAHLIALRTFNRLLAIDPDNAEVLDLVQGLHAEPARPPARKAHFATIAVGLAAMGILLFYFFGPVESLLLTSEVPVDASMAEAATQVPEAPPAIDTGQAPQDVGQPAFVADIEAHPGDPVDDRPSLRIPAENKEILHRPAFLDGPLAAIERRNGGDAATIRVILGSQTSWAHIYIDGNRMGTTGRGPVSVQPGHHVLTVRNDFSEPKEIPFDISPGESRIFKDLNLRPLPATVVIGTDIAPECVVEVDGTGIGKVQELKGSFSLPAPREPHRIAYSCPNGRKEYTTPPLKANSTVRIPE